jgi:hypothetical protein
LHANRWGTAPRSGIVGNISSPSTEELINKVQLPCPVQAVTVLSFWRRTSSNPEQAVAVSGFDEAKMRCGPCLT